MLFEDNTFVKPKGNRVVFIFTPFKHKTNLTVPGADARSGSQKAIPRPPGPEQLPRQIARLPGGFCEVAILHPMLGLAARAGPTLARPERSGSTTYAAPRTRVNRFGSLDRPSYGRISTGAPTATDAQISSISALVTATHPSVQSTSRCNGPTQRNVGWSP